MHDDPQTYYVFSKMTGPRRTFITRTGRPGSVSPYCHGFALIDARTFATRSEAQTWLICRRPEVRDALERDGFKLTEVRAEVIQPAPMLRIAACPETPPCEDCTAEAEEQARQLAFGEAVRDFEAEQAARPLVEAGLHPNERIGIGPGNLIADDAPDFDQWPSDEEIDMLAAVGALEDTLDGAIEDVSDIIAAEHLVETFKASLAKASKALPEDVACYRDELCECPKCKAEFAATS